MSDTFEMRERIIRLEQLFTHQDHLLAQLHEELLQLRSEYDRFTAQFEARIGRLESLAQHGLPDFDPDEKPPHY